MDQILAENKTIMNFLGKPKSSNLPLRFCHYVVTEPVEDGVLLFHTLTRELLLLSAEEYTKALENETLRQKWFVVPENTKEKDLAATVRWLYKTKTKEKNGIFQYIIYTTTDCNARCFYCFELGRKRIPMSDETALKAAQFIIDHHQNHTVHINWFGGEPLYNTRAMDIICEKLREAGIKYVTRTTSNGYLMNEENARKCVELWNLKRVQISMDGTEKVYNKAKHYIYKEGNPYHIVMDNIQRLLNYGVRVLVRVNLDFHNIEDLHLFTEELAQRFGADRRFSMYAHLIIDEKKPWYEHHSPEEWSTLYDELARLHQKMIDLGIFGGRNARISNELPLNHCMAESPNNVVIAPDGGLGVCEHYSETELYGHLDSDERDQSVIDSFRERWEDIPECDTCFNYPQCNRLKKCPYLFTCIEARRNDRLWIAKYLMRNEYRFWCDQYSAEDDLPELEANEL